MNKFVNTAKLVFIKLFACFALFSGLVVLFNGDPFTPIFLIGGAIFLMAA